MTEPDPVAVLQRWTDSGALWRVVSRTDRAVEVALLTCTGGEEVDRIRTTDPAALRYVGERWSSDE